MTDVLTEILAELLRAMKKFPTWPSDPLHALAVLGEEYGELTQAVLQRVYEPEKSSQEDIRCEAIQTAAMAIRFAMSLGQYGYQCTKQHDQTDAVRSLAELRPFAELVVAATSSAAPSA